MSSNNFSIMSGSQLYNIYDIIMGIMWGRKKIMPLGCLLLIVLVDYSMLQNIPFVSHPLSSMMFHSSEIRGLCSNVLVKL